jgi:hypothetical protein
VIRRDQVNAAEELQEAGAGDLVIDADAPPFALEQSGLFHDGEMFGKCRDIAARKGCQLIHTLPSMGESLHY